MIKKLLPFLYDDTDAPHYLLCGEKIKRDYNDADSFAVRLYPETLEGIFNREFRKNVALELGDFGCSYAHFSVPDVKKHPDGNYYFLGEEASQEIVLKIPDELPLESTVIEFHPFYLIGIFQKELDLRFIEFLGRNPRNFFSLERSD